jgi:hypothetical protein
MYFLCIEAFPKLKFWESLYSLRRYCRNDPLRDYKTTAKNLARVPPRAFMP